MRSIHSLFFIALFTLESFILVSSSSSSSNVNTTICLRRENDLFLKCPAPIADDFSASLFPSVIDVLKQQQQQQQAEQKEQQRQNNKIEEKQLDKTEQYQHSTVTKTSIVKQQQATQTPERKPLVSFEEWQKKQVLVNENDYSRHNSKRKSNTASSNGQQMVDSVDGGFSDDFGSMFEGSNVHMDMPNAQDKIIEPNNNKKLATGHSRTKFGDVRMKSLKERFNYASTDCAATVRKANREAKGANAILYESKDQYLLNKCSADNKFVIINLCEPIRIDTIVMANYEFFSSTFKDFRIYVADRYPSKDWQLLGQWQARNTRDLQVFRVDDKSGWPEYIKIEFISHYGREYYCPLSLVRVYGMSMMEYYNRVERQGLSDDDNDGDENGLEDEHLWPADVREQIIQPQFDITNPSEYLSVKRQAQDDEEDDDETLEEVAIKPVALDSTDSNKSMNNNQHTINDDVPENNRNNNDNSREAENIKETRGENTSTSVKSVEHPEINDSNMITTKDKTKTTVADDPQVATFDDENKNQPVSASSLPLSEKPSTESSLLPSSSLPASSSSVPSSFTPSPSLGEVSQSIESSQASKNSDRSQESNSSPSLSQQSESSSSSTSSSSKLSTDDKDSSSASSIASPEISSADLTPEEVVTSISSSDINKDGVMSSISPEPITTTTNQEFEKSTTTITSSSTEEVRQAAKIVVVPKEKSTTQESIYKTIMKRLNVLEVNATLSQRYLDEQNKMLNDVFLDMEKRHQEQLMMLIGHLNETASHKIDSMKRRYEKWYDDLKDQTENDVRDMTAKISILADQLSFERRVSLTQLIIIITIFVFMALSRGTFSTLSPVMAAREEERKKRQSANQAGVLLSTISYSLKPSQDEASFLPSTIPEIPRRHSDDPYFTMNLEEQRPRSPSTSSTISKKENQTLPEEIDQAIKNENNIISLGLEFSNKQSYEGLNIELEPELLSHKLNDILLKQQEQPIEQTVPSSSTQYIDHLLLSDDEDKNNTK